jgi:hypothetical protein
MKKEAFLATINEEVRALAEKLWAAAEKVVLAERASNYVRSIMDSAANIKTMRWNERGFTWEMAVDEALESLPTRKSGDIGKAFGQIVQEYKNQ